MTPLQIDAASRAQSALGVLMQSATGTPEEAKPVSFLDLSRRDMLRYSLTRALRELTYEVEDRRAGFERECSIEIGKRINKLGMNKPESLASGGMSIRVPYEVLSQRAMSTQPGSKGGYMVGTDNLGFIDVVRARSVAFRMGARSLPGLVGNITGGRGTATVSVTWQGGDGTSVSAADQTLGQLSMTQRSCIAITDVSEQLLRQTGPAADSFIATDLGNAVAIGVDNASINGTGGAQPLGILNTPGITTGQDAATATWTKLVAFSQTAGTANALRGRPGFVANSAGAGALMLKQRFSGTDSPLWDGSILDGTVTGLPAMSSEQVASGNLIFGSFDELVIGDWGVLELSTARGGTRFNQAQVGIRALWMVDVMLRYPAAFVVSTNLS